MRTLGQSTRTAPTAAYAPQAWLHACISISEQNSCPKFGGENRLKMCITRENANRYVCRQDVIGTHCKTFAVDPCAGTSLCLSPDILFFKEQNLLYRRAESVILYEEEGTYISLGLSQAPVAPLGSEASEASMGFQLAFLPEPF